MASHPSRPLRPVELLALAGAMAVFTGLAVGLVTREPLLALLFALGVAVVGVLVLGVLALVLGEHRRG